MKLNTSMLKALSVGVLLFTVQTTKAQCVSGECFLQGDFVEIGTAPNGAYGTCNDAPAGYHGRSPFGASGRALGFVADPDKDGWGVSSPGRPGYIGDYYLPGYPQEGWSIEYTGAGKSDAWRGVGCTSMTGGLTGANISCVTAGGVTTQVWQGTKGTLSITQTTILRKDKVYFVGFVDIVNTGAATVTNVYYNRTLDPDNEAYTPGVVGGYATDNTVVYQPTTLSKNCLVKAVGQTFSAYLGLGTKDCRAKAYICVGSGLTPTANLSNIYNNNGAASTYVMNAGGTSFSNDVGIGVVYNLGDLAPGQKTSLAYAYILKEADLDSALGETAPKFESSGSPYSPYTTFRVCPGKTVPLKVINGGQYKWIWTTTSLPHYMTAPGSSTLIPPGGTIPAVTGTRTYPNGAVSGDSVIVTVWGPKTYTAMGVSTCDTQYMIFYVDTISFSVPPSVTTPVRYCEGETAVPLTAGAAATATLKWYFPASVLLGGAPTPSTVFPPGSPTDFDTTDYFVSQINPAGCETPKAKIQVIVTKKPAAPEVKPLIYCLGDVTEPLTANGTNLKWYDAPTGGSRYPSTPTPISTKAGITSYYVSQTVNGCESERAELVVEISQATAAFTLSTDSLCGNELLTLTNNSTTSSPGSYKSVWSFGDGGVSTDSNTAHSYADARATYTIKLVVTNANKCKDSINKTVEVFKQPVMSVAASDLKICQGNAIDFTGTATPGYDALYWDFGDGDPAYGTLQVRHAFTQAGAFNVQLKGTYPACPEASAGVNVDIVAIPKVNLGNDTAFCPGSTTLTLRNLNSVPVDKYTWSTGDSVASIQVSNAGQYSLRAQNWKCESADSITVSKGCYLDIPNAFTPGTGGDYGSYFLPRDLLSRSVTTFQMKIFDRWGQLIFESDKVSGKGWDGKFKGQDMPMGVYVYMIQVSFANGTIENYNGNVTLLR